MSNAIRLETTRPIASLRIGLSNLRFVAGDARASFRQKGVLQPSPQPIATSEDGSTSLRIRDYGNRALPLSPLMDPVVIERRQRHKTPKRPRPVQMTDFQKKLFANPYGQQYSFNSTLLFSKLRHIHSASTCYQRPPMQRLTRSTPSPLPTALQRRL
jgi:hypothetical protein